LQTPGRTPGKIATHDDFTIKRIIFWAGCGLVLVQVAVIFKKRQAQKAATKPICFPELSELSIWNETTKTADQT